MMHELDTWINAVGAFARRDPETVAVLVVPDDLCGKAAYQHLIGLSLAGSYTCAAALARANGHPIGRVPAGYAYSAEPQDPTQEPSALERVAAGAIAACLHGDFRRAIDTFAVYSAGGAAGGLDRLVSIVMHLLDLSVRLTTTRQAG